ncbi:MAG: GMC family oxidoreductase [Chloroflexota bacterium]
MTETFDYIIIGSGFGGSVSAMRLAEKGYSVLVLEKGKRLEDDDFAVRTKHFQKYLWLPAVRAFGILQISILKGAMVLHGTGVGGGSLGYANVLEIPSDETFATPAWNDPLPWKKVLAPHYLTAQKMLGVARNPKLWPADQVLREIAVTLGTEATFRATDVGIFFGEEGEDAPDPYFDGAGPERRGCIHCGGCNIGCRHNAKNTLPKNYLFFAEQLGVQIRDQSEVCDVHPLPSGEFDGARYAVTYRSSTSIFAKGRRTAWARKVIFSAGVLGTVKLLLELRDAKQSLPDLSLRLGDVVRTNSEALLGSIARKKDIAYSDGISITSIFNADQDTRIEPVRYPEGFDLMRIISAPLISDVDSIFKRILNSLIWTLRHPVDFFKTMIRPGWAHNTTILLVMQHVDNRMKLRLGRSLFTLFRKGLVTVHEGNAHKISARVDIGHEATRSFADKTNGIPMGSLGENLLNLPTTAHILGGCMQGADADEGVVGPDFQVHNYPGLYVIDGSIVPANPGVNPSLTITALAEYAISQIADKTP